MSSRTRKSEVSCAVLMIVRISSRIADELKDDPLRGINVDAAGGASKVLKMLAEKVSPYALNGSNN